MTKKVQEKVKYKENPFLNGLNITTKGKQVKVTPLGSNKDNIVVNQSTGEVQGTHVVSYKQVDDKEFVKLFTGNIALIFDLSSSGRKAFDMLLHVVQKEAIRKDLVYIDDEVRADFTEEHKVKLATSTMYRGLENLVEKKILARSTRTNHYFINPSMIFNGDRLAFTKVIERKKESNKEKQVDIEEVTNPERAQN